MAGIETEGWAERHAEKKSPQGSAFPTPTRSYGDQRVERPTFAQTEFAALVVRLGRRRFHLRLRGRRC